MWSDYLLVLCQVGWVSSIFGEGNFLRLLRVFLVLLLIIGLLGVSKRYLYFRLNDHVHFVLRLI